MRKKQRPSIAGILLYALMALMLLLGVSGCSDDDDDGGGVIAPEAQGVLTDWKGDWVSHAVHLDSPEAEAGYVAMAREKPGYAAEDIKPVVKGAYYTEFGRLVISDDAITFYGSDGTTETCTCEYEDQGAGTMSGESARKFELKAGDPDACRKYQYLLMQPLMHHETGEEHLHIRYADADAGGFDALMEGEDNAGWWPILTRSDATTDDYVADYMLEFTDFYLSLLPETGTVVFEANGEDFVREGFVSEDGWRIDFSEVYVNVSSPAVYQVEAAERSARHAGHGDDEPEADDGPEALNRAVLEGDYFLNLKQETFEVGRNPKALPGTYAYLEFSVTRAASGSEGFQARYAGDSIVLAGTAVKDGRTVDFTIAFDEIMKFASCGPMDASLAADGEIRAEMTFHFDHIFGDFEEGPADPADTHAINYVAIGFQPFADLAENGVLEIRQPDMISEGMPEDIYTQLMGAVKTLGHTGESHCDCIPAAARRFLTNHGVFLLQPGDSFDDPRNPKRIVMNTTAESDLPTTVSFYADLDGETPLAEGCNYQYVGSRPDPHYFPNYKTSVWDLFQLEAGHSQACQEFAHIAVRSPHDSPPHMHFRYGDAGKSFDALLAMSNDPESGFDPWWSDYRGITNDTPPANDFSFLNVNGTLVSDDESREDPRNPDKIEMTTSTESNTTTRLTFYANGNPGRVWASGDYQYVGSEPDPHYFPGYKTSVWDLFELQNGISGDADAFRYVMFRSPHSNPVHVHMRYGAAGFEALLDMSKDPESGFDPWWSTYIEPENAGPLAAWQGDWRSHSVYMDGPEAEAAFETMAAQTGTYTAEDVKGAAENAYLTDFGALAINSDDITFYASDGATEVCTCAYQDRGEGTMSGESARKFELKADADEACDPYRYLLLQPLLHHQGGEEHLHVRYSATDFETLMEDPGNADWWPILTRTDETTATGVADYMLEFKNYYLSLLPDPTAWPQGAAPDDRVFNDPNAVVQEAVYDADGNLHALFLSEVKSSDLARHSVDSDVLGFKVMHGVKDAVTGEWAIEDVAATPGSGERGAAMAFDADGVIHVVFGYRGDTVANTSLGYLSNAGGDWGEVEWIDGEKSEHANAYTDSGDRPKIAVASDGRLMVAYTAWKTAVRLATFENGAWTIEDVEQTDDTEVIPGHNGMEFRIDSNDRPHLAYKCSDLELVPDENGDVVMAADGHPRGRIVGMHIRYAVKDQTGWTVENVGQAAGWTETFLVTLGFTLADDHPHVFTGYEDALDGVLTGVKCAKKIGGVWSTDVIYAEPDAYYGWFRIGAETDADQRIHISFCAQYSQGGDEAAYPTAGHSVMYGVYDGAEWQVSTAVGVHGGPQRNARHAAGPAVEGFWFGNSSDVAVNADGVPAIVFRGGYDSSGFHSYSVGGIYEWIKAGMTI